MGELKYKAFYDMAVSDLNASKLLLDNKYYCQALYFFEQAVEKQVKFLGLATGWLPEDKVKRIGHLPISFFDKLFNNQIIREFATVAKLDINDINDFGEYMYNMNVEDRVSIIKQSIAIADRYDSIKVPSGSNCSITLLKYYEDAKFNNEPEKAIKKAIETRDPTLVEAFCKREIELLNTFGKITGVIRLLSCLVSGIDQTTRYPNINGGDSPLDSYSAKSMIVNELPYFIEKLEIAGKRLYECSKELSNRKN